MGLMCRTFSAISQQIDNTLFPVITSTVAVHQGCVSIEVRSISKLSTCHRLQFPVSPPPPFMNVKYDIHEVTFPLQLQGAVTITVTCISA